MEITSEETGITANFHPERFVSGFARSEPSTGASVRVSSTGFCDETYAYLWAAVGVNVWVQLSELPKH